MEEKTQNGQKAQKYTYEQLNSIAGQLLNENRELKARMGQMQDALDSREFQYSAFLLESLFKVVEHPEMYKSEFVDKATAKIEEYLDSFMSSSEQKESKDEA